MNLKNVIRRSTAGISALCIAGTYLAAGSFDAVNAATVTLYGDFNCDGVVDLLADVEDEDEDRRDRDLVAAEARERREDDQHEDDARSAEERRSGEEEELDQARRERRQSDRKDRDAAAVLLLDHRATKKNVGNVSEEMIPAGMTEDVGDQPDVGHRVEPA